MSHYDELIQRLTHRLAIDPELRMDIANELRTHLEDTAEQFRQAGCTADEADANAVKALGDERDLTDLLWQANRRRIRIRRTIKWAARATLIPAAIVITLLVASHYFWSLRALVNAPHVDFTKLGTAHRNVLTEEQRLILGFDPRVASRLDRAKSIVDRWPDNPIYYGHYIVQYLAQAGIYDFKGNDYKIRKSTLPDYIAKLDRGKQVEPDNAWYNVMKAAVLIKMGSTLNEDADRTYQITDGRGRNLPRHFCRIKVIEKGVFDRALAELRGGLGKRHFTSHSIDMARLRVDMLPPPTGLEDYVNRIALVLSTLLPDLGPIRHLSKSILAYGLQVAEQGQHAESAELTRDITVLASKMGADSRSVIELLVADRIKKDSLAHAAMVFDALGKPEDAARVRAELEQQGAFSRSLYTGKDDLDQRVSKEGGILDSILVPALPQYEIDLAPNRKAEHAFASEFALTAFLVALVAITFLAGLLAVIDMVRCRRRDDGPKLLFVGWYDL